jgi:cytochrome P450
MCELYDMIKDWAEVGEIGSTPPVDVLPVFKWLPESIWANWKTRARGVGKAMHDLYHRLVEQVQTRRSEGINLNSIADVALSAQKFDRGEIDFACGIMIEAGSDTTSAMITVCLHAMAKYPDIQRKAHEEIDAAIPKDRSPQWSDYEKLPYVARIVKETLRWRPTAPLAIPHAANAGETRKKWLVAAITRADRASQMTFTMVWLYPRGAP